MSDNFNTKDYGDYFAELEKKVENENIKPAPQNGGQVFAHKSNKSEYQMRKRRAYIARFIVAVIAVLIAGAIVFAIIGTSGSQQPTAPEQTTAQDKNQKERLYANYTKDSAGVSDAINSKNVIFIDLESNTVIASRNADKKAYPASTTKIMTLLVAVENLKDLNDTFTMTYEITDPLWEAEATVAGFSAGEVINMTDLLYGTILPSGGDASIALAQKISGSEENFAKLMNQKAKELGLKNTNFTNCTGLFDKNHYTTAEDMAVILHAAMKNDLCKKILSTQRYVSDKTPQHPDGIEMYSTLFNYMYGTEPAGAQITGGKTGYVGESGYCIASFGTSDSGKEYICVTLHADTRWPAVYDQINLFGMLAGTAGDTLYVPNEKS